MKNIIEHTKLNAEWWQEIKFLEQEYNRNLKKIAEAQERNQDTSFRVQKILDNINKLGEDRDNYLFEHNLGEYGKNN